MDHSVADKPQVVRSPDQQKIQQKRPQSFEIDESKLGPSLREWEWDYLRDPPKDVVKLLRSKGFLRSARMLFPHLHPRSHLIDRYIDDLSGNLSYLSPKAQVGLVYGGEKHSDRARGPTCLFSFS